MEILRTATSERRAYGAPLATAVAKRAVVLKPRGGAIATLVAVAARTEAARRRRQPWRGVPWCSRREAEL